MTDKLIDSFIDKLRQRHIKGSLQVSIETGKILRNVIGQTTSKKEQNSPESLKSCIKNVGLRLMKGAPMEFAVQGMVRRVLHMIDEEEESLSQASMNENEEESPDDHSTQLKTLVKQGITEIIDEIENSTTNIQNQALEHIHSNEIILTMGLSEDVAAFLKEAARVRKFQVIIAETAPHFKGQQMALTLSKSGIDTTVINDSAVFAVMSRVNKVILGAHAILANGGLLYTTGAYNVAIAASYHSIPLVICAGLHTISPIYPYDSEKLNVYSNPDFIFPFKQCIPLLFYIYDLLDNQSIQLINPDYDYIPPNLLALFITNVGPQPPFLISKLLLETYGREE